MKRIGERERGIIELGLLGLLGWGATEWDEGVMGFLFWGLGSFVRRLFFKRGVRFKYFLKYFLGIMMGYIKYV